jgi:hypothetical protein
MTALPPTDSEAAPTLPPQGVRTTLSLLLVIHLFALLVAVASNFLPVSPMRAQLRDVPLVRPYLQLLHMDLAYNYHLTYATEVDFDHRLVIQLAGDAPEEAIVLPTGLWPPVRQQRLYNLTRTMALNLGDDATEGVLPRTVAAGLLARRDIASGPNRLRLEYFQPVRREDYGRLTEAGSTERDGTFRTAYEANLIRFGGQWSLVKQASASEAAPVVDEP